MARKGMGDRWLGLGGEQAVSILPVHFNGLWILKTRRATSKSPLAFRESIDQTVVCHNYSTKRGSHCREVLKDDDPMKERDTSALSELSATVSWKKSQNARPTAHLCQPPATW
jgi:hypothetical protein